MSLDGRDTYVVWDYENQRVPNKGNVKETIESICLCISTMGGRVRGSINVVMTNEEASAHVDYLRTNCNVLTVKAGPDAVDTKVKAMIQEVGAGEKRIAVCLVAGDGGYADTMKMLRARGIPCGVLYLNSSALSMDLWLVAHDCACAIV